MLPHCYGFSTFSELDPGLLAHWNAQDSDILMGTEQGLVAPYMCGICFLQFCTLTVRLLSCLLPFVPLPVYQLDPGPLMGRWNSLEPKIIMGAKQAFVHQGHEACGGRRAAPCGRRMHRSRDMSRLNTFASDRPSAA